MSNTFIKRIVLAVAILTLGVFIIINVSKKGKDVKGTISPYVVSSSLINESGNSI